MRQKIWLAQFVVFFLPFSLQEVKGKKCYDELGCFPLTSPWTSLLRPLPRPQPPQEINVKISLYTRDSDRYNVTLWPKISLEGSTYNSKRPITVFITHGFSNDGEVKWLHKLKNAYLKVIDANVFIVDWGKGARKKNYLQVASNTRIVGAELARFGKYLIQNGLKGKKIHLIGHSLGAHISGYMAKSVQNISKIGRITALDPAQPCFEFTPKEVRLAKGDANFVDVYHTDAKPFIPFLGLGMMSPIGDVDFYFNRGTYQPGCIKENMKNVTSLNDLFKRPVEFLYALVACSHVRAIDIFISTMQTNCSIWGRKMLYAEKFLKVTSLGILSLADPLVNSISKCNPDICTVAGLETQLFKARGIFLCSTKGSFPYCEKDNIDVDVNRFIVKEVLNDVFEVASGIFSLLEKKYKFLIG